MFNLQGSEIIFILLIALVVLGPEKLPGAIRRITTLYAELRKLSSGFQDEFKSALDEPIREIKSTADLMRNAADPKQIAEESEREAELEAAAAKKARQASDTTSAMEAAGAAHLAQADALPSPVGEPDTDPFADPVEHVQPTVADPSSDPDDAAHGDVGVDDQGDAKAADPAIRNELPAPGSSSARLDPVPHTFPDPDPGMAVDVGPEGRSA